ncbi:MAG: AbrB family transcriptional regulator [Cyanobacteria bacterium P01_A01_bin.45]
MNQNIKNTDNLNHSLIAINNDNLPIGKQICILSWQILLALPLSLVLSRLNLGGMAWIFGGIFAGVIVLQISRIIYKISPPPNRDARHIGLMLVGLSIGFSMTQSNFITVATGIPVFVFLTFFLLVSGSIIGYFYSRFTQTNLLTSMLATVPGGVGVMSAIAADYDKNVTLVALVQVIRVTSVVILIPLIARISTDYDAIEAVNIVESNLGSLSNYFTASNLILSILVIFLSIAAVNLSILLKVPAAHFFATLMLGLLFHPLINHLPMMAEIKFNLPSGVAIFGQILLGITVGEYWGKETTFQKKTVAYALISTFMTLLAGAIASLMAMKLTDWDWLTCMLVTAPGGAAEMILVALTLNHDVEVVTIGHLVRLIAINSSLPIWVYLFRRLDTQVSESV